MNNIVKLAVIIAVGLLLSLVPAPEGLSRDGWIYFSLFVAVFIALILEPFPSAYTGLLGVVIACLLRIGPPAGQSVLSSEKVLSWGLSGFSNTTVWLIFVAFMFALGYEKTGLGKRISLFLVSKMGRKTLGLGYSVAISDLLLAPFTPSNTARSGGTIFPIVKHIPPLYDSSPDKEPRKIGAYLAWVGIASTCVTSSMFSTAMATNLLGISLVEDLGMKSPSWGEWFLYFLPVGIILIIMVPLLTYFVYPPQLKTSESIPLWADGELKRLGRISSKEKIMAMLSSLALILWIFGKYFDINATVAALAVLCLMVLFGILDWNDIISNKAAWNVFLWFGALVTLAGGLNNVGFLNWFANRITSATASFSPFLILLFLLIVFFFSHYLFASATAHATALTTLFLTTAKNIPGVNLPLMIYLILFTYGMMGILTPYATGPSPIWYGFGYIKSGTFWKLGAFFGVLFILVLIIVGIPWISLWL